MEPTQARRVLAGAAGEPPSGSAAGSDAAMFRLIFDPHQASMWASSAPISGTCARSRAQRQKITTQEKGLVELKFSKIGIYRYLHSTITCPDHHASYLRPYLGDVIG